MPRIDLVESLCSSPSGVAGHMAIRLSAQDARNARKARPLTVRMRTVIRSGNGGIPSPELRQAGDVWDRRSVPWMLLAVLGCLTAGAAALGIDRSPVSTNSARPAPSFPPSPAPVTPPVAVPNVGAYRIPAGTTFSVSTTQWTVGELVTLSGNNCPASEGIATSLAATTSGAPFSRGADGKWSVTATVPVGAWGPEQASATCGDLSAGAPLFKYPQTYSVFISTPYALNITPSGPLAPGSPLTVTPTASFCSTLDTIEVGVALLPTPFTAGSGAPWLVQPVLAETQSSTSGFEVINDVPWSAVITIPPDAHSGNYYVAAACMMDNRGSPRLYAAQKVEVVATSVAGTATLNEGDLLSPGDLPSGWKKRASSTPHPPIPACYAKALSLAATPLATLKTIIVRAGGRPVAFEQLVLFSGTADTSEAYTAITIALSQCGEMGIPGVLREYPKIAPTFIGSEGFVDQQTRGSIKSYQALVVARRGTTVVAVAVANHGAVDARLIHHLVTAALRKAPR
jgi:hypothetical protein